MVVKLTAPHLLVECRHNLAVGLAEGQVLALARKSFEDIIGAISTAGGIRDRN